MLRRLSELHQKLAGCQSLTRVTFTECERGRVDVIGVFMGVFKVLCDSINRIS